jgi:hypothetical protein
VKTTLSALALLLALGLTALAAESKKPALSQHRAREPSVPLEEARNNSHSVPPSLRSPCLFYGGDINPASLNAAGLSDENTLLILGGSSTYASFTLQEVSARSPELFQHSGRCELRSQTAT